MSIETLTNSTAPGTAETLLSALDEYERRTKLLPAQHEIPERGCCSYNWRMAIIKEIRALVASPTAAQEQKPVAYAILGTQDGKLYVREHIPLWNRPHGPRGTEVAVFAAPKLLRELAK